MQEQVSRGAGESAVSGMLRTCLEKDLANLTQLWHQPCCEQQLGLETSRGPSPTAFCELLLHSASLPNDFLHIAPTTSALPRAPLPPSRITRLLNAAPAAAAFPRRNKTTQNPAAYESVYFCQCILYHLSHTYCYLNCPKLRSYYYYYPTTVIILLSISSTYFLTINYLKFSGQDFIVLGPV